MTITVDELRKLLDDTDWMHDGESIAMDAGSMRNLARRVIAAEKLVDALQDALDAWDTHNETGDMMQGYWAPDARAALAEYEATK